jgi:hypothetical protein
MSMTVTGKKSMGLRDAARLWLLRRRFAWKEAIELPSLGYKAYIAENAKAFRKYGGRSLTRGGKSD